MRYFGHVGRENSLERPSCRVWFWKEEPRKANNSLDGRHDVTDMNENHKGDDKTGRKQEEWQGAHTTRHGRSATDGAN